MKKALTVTSTLLSSLALATPAFAQTIGIEQPEQIQITDLGKLVSSLASVALIISGILVFLYLVWGGVEWITSGGDKTKTEKAQQRITSAVIGLAIVAASWALIRIIGAFFGVDIFDATKSIQELRPF